MLSSDKRRDSQRKSSLKGNGVREKKKDKEVREIWFNPHATEMRESQMDLCDCECQLLRDERVQRELQRLAKVYSQVDMEEENEEEPQTEESQTKGCCGGSKNKKPKEKGSQSKQKSEKAATKSKNTKKEQPKSRDKKEMTRDKKDNSATRKSNGKEDSNENKERTQSTIVHRNCRFKTREEAKRYKELKSIYTTHPRQRPSTVNNKKKEESQKGKQKGQKDLEKCPGSSSDESTHTQEETPATKHKARKDTEHTSRRPRPRPHSSSSDYPQESANRQRKKEGSKSKQKKKKSGGGCCGGRAKSDDEDDAYKPTRKSSDASSASNRHAVLPRECPWTSEELEQLAKLRATYTRDIAQKNMRKQVEQQAQPQPDKNDTGCCGSKKKKRPPTEDKSNHTIYSQYSYDLFQHYDCRYTKNYATLFKQRHTTCEFTSEIFTIDLQSGDAESCRYYKVKYHDNDKATVAAMYGRKQVERDGLLLSWMYEVAVLNEQNKVKRKISHSDSSIYISLRSNSKKFKSNQETRLQYSNTKKITDRACWRFLKVNFKRVARSKMTSGYTIDSWCCEGDFCETQKPKNNLEEQIFNETTELLIKPELEKPISNNTGSLYAETAAIKTSSKNNTTVLLKESKQEHQVSNNRKSLGEDAQKLPTKIWTTSDLPYRNDGSEIKKNFKTRKKCDKSIQRNHTLCHVIAFVRNSNRIQRLVV